MREYLCPVCRADFRVLGSFQKHLAMKPKCASNLVEKYESLLDENATLKIAVKEWRELARQRAKQAR